MNDTEKDLMDQPSGLFNVLQKCSNIFELIAAIIMSVAIVIAFFRLVPALSDLVTRTDFEKHFLHFLKSLFNIVIGIEFLKMLSRPNADNVLETLIFLVARHMIIATTTPVQDLISTISIILLLVTKKLIRDSAPNSGLAHFHLRKRKQETEVENREGEK